MAVTLNYNWQTIKGWTVWRGNGQIEFYIDAKLNKQDTNNNYSVVDTKLRSVRVKALAGSGYSFSLTGANTISGDSVWTFETEDILTGQITVKHNTDGSCNTVIGANIYNRYWAIDENQSETVNLPSIPRASRIDSFVGGDIEGKFYATYTSYIPQWENRLKISSTNDKTLALYENYISGTQVDLTEYAISYIIEQMNVSGVSSIVLKGEILTYNGDTYIGKSQAINLICTFSNAEPEFTYTFKEINSDVIEVMGDSGDSLINNVSVVEIEVNPTVKKGAEVKSVTVEHSGKTEEKKENFVFQIPVISGDFVITLTDSRNVSVSQKITKELIEYIPVKINKFDFRRVNPTSSNIVFNLESSFTNKKFNQTNNEAVVQFKLDDGDFIDIPKTEYYIDTEENTLSISNYLIQNILDYRVQGIFSVKIEDLFSVSENKMKVIKGIPTFDYGEHDLKVNGLLYIANEDGEQKTEIRNLKEISTFYLTSRFITATTNITVVPLKIKESNKTDEDSIFLLQNDGTIKFLKDCNVELSCGSAFGSFTANIIRRIGIVDKNNTWLTQCMAFQSGYMSFVSPPVYYEAKANDIIKFVVKQDSQGQCEMTDNKYQSLVTIREI